MSASTTKKRKLANERAKHLTVVVKIKGFLLIGSAFYQGGGWGLILKKYYPRTFVIKTIFEFNLEVMLAGSIWENSNAVELSKHNDTKHKNKQERAPLLLERLLHLTNFLVHLLKFQSKVTPRTR